MVCSTSLIILNVTKVGETSVVLHTLSPVYGRRSFIVSVPKGRGMALYLPLNILDAEVVDNARSDLWRVRNLSAKYPLDGIRSNMYKNTMTLFMSEVLYRTVHDGACEPGLFEWCCRDILTLDAMEDDFSNFHLRFLLELASAMGFGPSLEDLAPFAGPHLGTVSSLLELDFASCMLLPLSGEARNGTAEALLKYLGHHTETNLNIRSLKVLREVYSV